MKYEKFNGEILILKYPYQETDLIIYIVNWNILVTIGT